MVTLRDVSIIVPIAEGDRSWKGLVADLDFLPPETEVIFAVTGKIQKAAVNRSIKYATSNSGRGRQINAGAKIATKKYLWFLHADSRFTRKTIKGLAEALGRAPNSLIYFDLEFLPAGPKLMALTELGVWFRSHFLGLPFGDQGLCISSQLFRRLGGFRTDVPYGEDHLFVWKARQERVPLYCAGERLKTSPRKYARDGWFKTTVRHQILTYKQVFPEYIKWMRTKGFTDG